MVGAIATGLSGRVAHAQNPVAVCLAMVTDAARNVGVETSSSSFLSTFYSNYCETDGSTKSSAFNAGISAIIDEIPVDLMGGGTDTTTELKNFCENYQSTYASRSTSSRMKSIVVQNALESANQCL
jgi:hypothetical protein